MRSPGAWLAALFALGAAAAPGNAQSALPRESDYYSIDFLRPPPGEVLEVGGMDLLPDGRLVVSTRRGQVWIVENPTARDPGDASFHLFAEGLHEGLGLKVVNGDIYVLQRTELSRLRDLDRDGVADRIDVISNDWGASGNYHEFAFGLPQDRDGSFYAALNVGFWEPRWWHGKSKAPYRGWVLRIRPDGATRPFALGFRSPNGLGTNAAGDVFVTDNQGDWIPACPLIHVKEGSFYGHPASLDWTPEYRNLGKSASDTEPPERPRTPPALWFPYGLSRSTGSLSWDSSEGRFGPFREQMFAAELTNGLLMRVLLEKVQGDYQGAVLLFRKGVGSANRLVFAKDGTLLVGLTNRGWGGEEPPDGIARVRFTGKLPMELEAIHLVDDGFEVTFTKPLARSGIEPKGISLEQYDYNYWWEYGSPETNQTAVEVAAVEVSSDRRRLAIHARNLEPGKVARLILEGISSDDGLPLLHPQIDYTINQLPHGPRVAKQVANLVAPPLAREERARGWLRLFDGSSLAGWSGKGWRVAELLPARGDGSELPIRDGEGAMVNDRGPAGQASDLVSRTQFGDVEARIDFRVAKGGNSGIYFMGRYELQILDSFGKEEPTPADCGGIYEGEGPENRWPGRAPRRNASLEPNSEQSFEVVFRAPRFDARGRKIANAKFISVKLNDQLVQEDVEVPGPTRGGSAGPEAPIGPLRLQGDHGPVAYEGVAVRLIEDAAPAEPGGSAGTGWKRIFNGRDLEGWQPSGSASWRVEDGTLVGRGEPGALATARREYRNFDLRASVRINDAGRSGIHFRAASGGPALRGYLAPINSTARDPVKTGSLAGLFILESSLVPPDTWFTEEIHCEDAPEGVRVVIKVNGLVVADVVDARRRHASGPIVLEQSGPGSVVQFRDVELRELP